MVKRYEARRRAVFHAFSLPVVERFFMHFPWWAKAVTAAMYFCDPYCSGQRGTNENTKGLIRQYFPKGTDFRQVSNAELRKVVEKLNDRPRERLGYRRRCF